jgi:hypothetical protein
MKISEKKFDFMESLITIKDQTNLEHSIINIGKELIDEGFDYQDICEYILAKVEQCLAESI